MSLAAGLVALLSLVGTFLGRPLLATLGNALVPMSPLAAGLVILLVGAIPGAERWTGAARASALAVVGGVGAVSLSFVLGHLPGGTLAFETWLLRFWPKLQLTSVLTDLSLLGIALSYLVRRLPGDGLRTRQAAALLALAPLLLGLGVLFSYASGAPLLYGTARIPMSLPAALCVLLLGSAQLLAAGRDTWPLAAFRNDRPGATFGFSPRMLTITLCLAAGILVGGSFLLRQQLRAARTQVETQLSTIADLKAKQIAEWVSDRRGDAHVIAQGALIQTQLQRYLAGSAQAPTDREVRSWMTELQRTFNYRQVTLFDAQGQVRLLVRPDHLPAQPPEPPVEVRQALAAPGVVVADLHQLPGSEEVHLGFWIPVRGTAGGPAQGALLLMADAATHLFPLIQSWPTPSPSAESLLVRREGDQVLYLNNLRHQEHTALRLRFDLAAYPDMPATRAVLGMEGLVEGKDYRGVPVVSVLRKVPGTPWHMVAKVDSAEVYGPLRQSVWLSGLGLLLLLLLLGAGLGVLQRHRDAERLRGQLHLVQRVQVLMQEAGDAILVMDGEGRILEANAQAAAYYGYSQSELVGLEIFQLREAGGQAESRDRYRAMLQAGSARFEAVHQRRDGSAFPVEVSVRALELDGAPVVIGFVRDITERRVQEHKVQRMTELYSALSQVNQAIVWSQDREALFAKICEVMVEFGKFDMAWIGLDDPRAGQVRMAASHGDRRGYLDRIQVASGPTVFGAGPVGRAIREAGPCVMNDFLNTPGTEPWRADAMESGFRAVAAFPIRQDGQVIGALCVYSRETGFFGAPEEALLVEAAMDISFALDHLALDDQRRSAEIALLESERRLKEAQEAGGIGTYTFYIREDCWTGSPYLDQLFGIGQDHPRTLEGWLQVVAPDFRDRMAAYFTGIIERHEPFDLDYPILRAADGQRRWVHGRGEIHRDADDQPVAMVGIIQDITERKVAEEALMESNQRLRLASDSARMAVWDWDLQAGTMIWDDRMFELYGTTRQEIQGSLQAWKDGLHPEDFEGAVRECEAALRGEAPFDTEFRVRHLDGTVLWIKANATVLRDSDGNPARMVGVNRDVTDRHRAEVEKADLQSQLHQSQKLESLGSLAGGVAHDMNNVLGAILGLASTLRETANPFSPAAKNLDTIMTACMRGRGVVKSLLYFARKDLQEERSIDLNELVREMSQLLGHTTPKRIQLRLELAEGLGWLRGDPGALSHGLMNLCVNALDATPGTGTLRIRTQADEAGGLVLRVEDTGEGMPPEVLAKAMDPFFTTKPQGKGTGLGLGMVFGTMQAHEGAFELHSEVGKGTEAILRFPASRVVAPELAASPEPGSALQSDRSLTILLVDDDDLIRESAVPLLEVIGHKVTEAATGARAIQLLEDGLAVDLVILDMNMPGLSGAETLPRLLSLRPGLPVIMASGYSDDEISPLLEGRPSVTSIRKPYSLKEIQLKIANLQLQPTPETPGV